MATPPSTSGASQSSRTIWKALCQPQTFPNSICLWLYTQSSFININISLSTSLCCRTFENSWIPDHTLFLDLGVPRGREHKNLSSEVVFNPRRGLQSVWVALQPDCDLISLSALIVWAWVGQLKGEAGNEHTKKAIATLSWNFRCCSQMPGLVDLPSHMNAFLTGLPWCRARQTRNMGMNQLTELRNLWNSNTKSNKLRLLSDVVAPISIWVNYLNHVWSY